MNQTQDPTGDAPGGNTETPPPPAPPQMGPRVTGAQMRDLRVLRRSVTDRKIAGVAGGLGRHLDVDPTVLRVLFVVFSFFGGAGLVLYGALWLLVAQEGRDRSVISTGNDMQKALLIGAAVAAAVLVVGPGGGWFGQSLPVVLIVFACVVALLLRERRNTVRPVPYDQVPGVNPPAASYAAPTAPYAAPGSTGYLPDYGTGVVTPPPPPRPAWAPPPYVPPAPRPRRTGLVLFWPTLALVAIGLGALGIYDTAGNQVAQSAYAALALGVIGAMLVVGAFVGRPGGLILLGVIAALTLAVGSVTGGFHEGRSATYTPVSASSVQPTYDMKTGELVLDLSQVPDLDQLDGRTVRIDGNAGRIEVVVPSGLTVDVNADIRFAGGITIGDSNNGGGVNPSASKTLGGHVGDPALDLEIDLRVGEIDVRQQ